MHPKNRRRKNGSAMKMLGAQLAHFRKLAGYTQESLAEAALMGVDLIASIEQGRRPLKLDQAIVLDELLGTKGALQTALAFMPDVDRIPAWAEDYVDLEGEAIALSWFENQVLPGLLQTEGYARAVLGNKVPAFDGDQVAGQTAARLDRQAVLQRKVPPTVSFVIWEPAAKLNLGTEADYKEQIRHLRQCADLPCVTLQILPLEVRSHAGLDGPFILLETPDHQHLGYTETQRGSQLISDADEISILAQKYAMLRTQALNAEDTKSLLDRLGE